MKISRIITSFIDTSRTETLHTQGGPRRVPVSFFYPAAMVKLEQQEPTVLSLFEPAVEKAVDLFSRVGVPEEKLRNYPISIYNQAPPAAADQPHPVVVFSPGFGVDRDLYVAHICALVEAGYLVVTVGATYDSLFTVFPDGEVVIQSERCSSQDWTDLPSMRELVRVRIEDVKFVLSQLPLWNEEDSPLHGKFDLDRIGLIGHSLGGAAVLQVAREDHRVRAAVLLDASLHLPEYESKVNFAVLNVRQEKASLEEMLKTEMKEVVTRAYVEGQQRLYDCAQGARSFVKIQGADHMSFTTIPELFDATDSLKRVQQAIHAVTIAFLDEFVSGHSGHYAHFLASKGRPTEVQEIDRNGISQD